jgi:hypothetical protein
MWRLDADDDDNSTGCAKLRSILSMRPIKAACNIPSEIQLFNLVASVHVYLLL